MMATVFMGGTCNGSTWREKLIELHPEIDWFNPVVDDWNEEAQKREIEARETCDYVLYVITPKMTGAYSIAEVVDDSNKRPQKTLFLALTVDQGEIFTEGQIRSLDQVEKMVRANGGSVFGSLSQVGDFIKERLSQNTQETVEAELKIQVLVSCPYCGISLNLLCAHDNAISNYECHVRTQSYISGEQRYVAQQTLSIDDVTCSHCRQSFNVKGLES